MRNDSEDIVDLATIVTEIFFDANDNSLSLSIASSSDETLTESKNFMNFAVVL